MPQPSALLLLPFTLKVFGGQNQLVLVDQYSGVLNSPLKKIAKQPFAVHLLDHFSLDIYGILYATVNKLISKANTVL